MKKITLALLLSIFIAHGSISAKTIEPIKREIGRLTISIDPRFEALSAIQAVSDYVLIRRKGAYYNRMRDYFMPYSNLSAITVTNNLQKKYGYALNKPVTFMLHLSQPKNFDQMVDYSEEVITAARGEKNLNEYRESIHEFVNKSDFSKFWDDNIVFYNKVIDLTLRLSHKVDWVKTLEDYYNQSQNSYNIILSPLLYNGNGLRMTTKSGELDLYNICPANEITPDGIHALSPNSFTNFTWHEFSHSFVNALGDKYIDRLKKTSRLFSPVRKSMEKQYYRRWITCINEHIVRAVVVRLYSLHLGEDAGNKELQKQLKRDFIYIEPIIEKLKEYEALKEANSSLTFAEFFPEIVGVFETLHSEK